MFKRILFAHDATPAAERALPYLEHLARVEEGTVLVLHVYEPAEQYNTMQGYEAMVASLEALSRELVEDAVDYLETAGVAAEGLVRAGAPAAVILQTAMEQNVALIVLGTRGPSNVKDLLLGDVSTEVLRYARCPVLLVP
ncbi:MAG: universal stress protein [Anaerolineae bacterium]|jgi:nucleotide-binding universal stress UspA family protein|nr:universal stress protein [Anaerolineae bacterium]